MAEQSILSRIGPAFIVGACVIGPGSVTMMSTTGANYGYRLLWLSLAAGALMAGFLALFTRFGIYCDDTFLGLTTKKLGRPYAVLCGISIFLVSAAFQFGNALGVTAGMEALFGNVWQYLWPIAFTTAAIVFLFGFKQIYGVLEKMMTFFLVFMALAFMVNLVWAGPNVLAALKGACIPGLPDNVDWENAGEFWVTIGGLIGTTFCISAAFLQPYLVKAKGWTEKDLANGLVDTLLASFVLTLVGAMIMMTAATVLFSKGVTGTVNFGIMISQLEEAFGSYARLIFSIGFFSAAFSSFITNSLIGGVLLNDGLGFGGKLESMPTKIFATGVLLTGMTTAIFIIHAEEQGKQQKLAAAGAPAAQSDADAASLPEPEKAKKIDLKIAAIRVGQASTMLAVPLGAIAMVLVLFDRRANPGGSLSIWAKAFVLGGAAVLLGIAAKTYVTIKPELMSILGLG